MTSTTTSTKRAVGYLRVSTPGQTGVRHSSLETQESRFIQYCEALGYSAVSTFVDVVSGRRDDRQEYLRMVDFAMNGGANVIVVQFLDRFGRNPREILQRYWQLQDSGVEVVATDEDIKEELILLIKAGLAGAESRRTSERVRANMSRAVQKGVHAARAPFGLKRVYEGRDKVRWEIEPLEGPIVREMYKLAAEENLGFKAIANRLTDKGYKGRSGRPFASFTIQKVLTNEAMMGTLTYGKRLKKGSPPQELVRVDDFFPPILTNDEWNALQQRLEIRRESSRGRTHSSPYLLSGIARCGHCGGPMVGKSGSMFKGKRYRNYYCSRAMRSKEFCDTYNGHSAQKLEAAVSDYLGQFSDPELVREHLEAARSEELEKKRSELADVRRALDDVEAQFQKRLDLLTRGVLIEEEFVKANEGLREQRTALESRRAELLGWLTDQQNKVDVAAEVPSMIKSFREDLESLEVRRQKARLQTILSGVHVYKGARLEIEFRS